MGAGWNQSRPDGTRFGSGFDLGSRGSHAATPSVTNFHEAIIGSRAIVTIMVLGVRPSAAPTRSFHAST